MTSERRTLAILGAMGIVLFTLLALFLLRFERRSVEVPITSGPARTNHYLAAVRLFEAMNLEVRPIGNIQLDPLPPADGTLFFPQNRAGMRDARSNQLHNWVASGGHLVVVTYAAFEDGDEDAILDPLGLRQYIDQSLPDRSLDEEEMDLSTEPGGLEEGAAAPPPRGAFETSRCGSVGARLETGSSEELLVEFDARFRFIDTAERAYWTCEGASGIHLVQIREGAGLITALTDAGFLQNEWIERRDHAELAYRLATALGRKGPVVVIYDSAWPGPIRLLWEHAWMVVISLSSVLIVWVWKVSRRYGRRQPDDPPERRRLMEHIEAAGWYYYRSGAAPRLLAEVTADLIERLRMRHPGWAGLSSSELHTRLAQISSLPVERVQHALKNSRGAINAAPRLREDDLVEAVAIMEQIRKSL